MGRRKKGGIKDGPRDSPWTVHATVSLWRRVIDASRIKAGRYVPEPPISEPLVVSEGRSARVSFRIRYNKREKWEWPMIC